MNITDLIDRLIAREGGYVDHPADRGGATRWGITVAVARANG
jgi:lysozyme family protein